MSVANPEQILFTPKQAAAVLSLSQRTLWSLTARGELRATRVGRCVRYSRAALEDFVNRQTEPSGNADSSR